MAFFEIGRGMHLNLQFVAAVLPSDPDRPDPSPATASVIITMGGWQFHADSACARLLAREMAIAGGFFAIDDAHGINLAHVVAAGAREGDATVCVVYFADRAGKVEISAEAGARMLRELKEPG